VKLLFTTIAAGGGHVATAHAMAQAVEARYPGQFEIVISDFMAELLLGLDKRHKDFWRWALAHPQVARQGQRVMDSLPTVTRAYHRQILTPFARQAAPYLQRAAPALIIANHGWLTMGLTLSRQKYGLTTPVLSFATEPLDASALWAEPEAEQFVVPSQDAKRNLVRMGVPASRISVIGYPVKQAFLQAPSKQQARRELGLEDTFTCLISLGSEGISANPTPWLEALTDVQLVVISGRNSGLQARLQRYAAQRPRMQVRGFVEDMASYVAASDVVIGKAGPASVFEALAVGRPFLALSYVGLNERKVLKFLRARGLGRYFRGPEALAEAVACYRQGPGELAQVERTCRELELPSMTARVAEFVVHYARTGHPQSQQEPGLR
jgi:UDP-N-acetylglucosamine:LPS N-acetylglucosamine transferase